MLYSIVNNKKILSFFFLSNILLLSSCTVMPPDRMHWNGYGDAGWVYSPVPGSSSGKPPIINMTLSVPPLIDSRVYENDSMRYIQIIPLMPYGWQELSRPEDEVYHFLSNIWYWIPNEDIAKAIAGELNGTNIFKDVFFPYELSEGELILQGTINSTKYEGKLFSYGLSFYGGFLHLIGFPWMSIENELNLTFQLKSANKESILWEKSYSEKQSDLIWVTPPRWFLILNDSSDFNYPSLLKKIMARVVNDLKQDSSSIKNKLNNY